MKNYYKILDIQSQATEEKIEFAYRRALQSSGLFMNHHKKELIRRAYETLRNLETRKLYDEEYKKYDAKLQILEKLIESLKNQLNHFNPVKRDILNDTTIECLEKLTHELRNSEISTLKDEEDLTILDHTIDLISVLTTASDQDCKQIILNYGKKIREAFQNTEVWHFIKKYEPDSMHDTKKTLTLINDIFVNSLSYGIAELELFKLDNEIERLKDIAKQTQSSYYAKFLNYVIDYKANIRKNIRNQCKNNKNWESESHVVRASIAEVTNSTAFTSITDTSETLQKNKYTHQSKKNDKQNLLDFYEKYKHKAKEKDEVKNFMKSVAIIVASGLSAILAVPIALLGCVIGCVCGGPAGIISLALPAMAAMDTRDMCKETMGLPLNVSLSQHLLFKNIASDAARLAKKGANLLDSKESETQDKKPRALAEYFAFR